VLTGTFARLKAVHPETANSTWITVGDITYYDDQHALVAMQLRYAFGKSDSAGNFFVGAQLLDGHWKVSRANYCDILSLTGVACPAS
jgi:hypothetical protein